MTKTFTFLFIACFTLLLTSCLNAECVDDTKVYVKVFFYSYDTKKIESPDSVTLYGVGNDIKIYDNQKITLPALIPLKNYDNETAFVIQINETTDTIRFVHSNFLRLISKECGYLMNHTIDAVDITSNGIDSISITNNEVTVKNIENVALFY